MVTGTVAFEDFMRELGTVQGGQKAMERDLGAVRTDVRSRIESANRKVQDETLEQKLGDVFKDDFKQRGLLINPDAERKLIKKAMWLRDGKDEFHTNVSTFFGAPVEVTNIQKGWRNDGRDFLFEGRNQESGVNVDDFRVLLGVPERKKQDTMNTVSQDKIYESLGLHFYRQRASLD
jgi:hypothetical protein